MIGRKVANASELLWESLDSRERMMVIYAGVWVMVLGLLSLQRRSRERFRRELLDEVHHGR